MVRPLSPLLSPGFRSAPASSPSAWCRAASVNQQHPLNRFLAGSMSAPERGTVQPCHSQTPLHPPSLPGLQPLPAPRDHSPAPAPWVARSSPAPVGNPQPSGRVKAEQQTRRQLLQLQSLLRSTPVSPALPEDLPSCRGHLNPPYLAVAGAARGHWYPRWMWH